MVEKRISAPSFFVSFIPPLGRIPWENFIHTVCFGIKNTHSVTLEAICLHNRPATPAVCDPGLTVFRYASPRLRAL